MPLPFFWPSAASYLYLWVTNAGAAEITANSIASLARAGVSDPDRLVVALLDERAGEVIAGLGVEARFLRLAGVDVWRARGIAIGGGYSPYDTPQFRNVCLARYFAIDHVLGERRRPVVSTDGDIAFLRDPAPHFRELVPGVRRPVLTQNDRRASEEAEEWSVQYEPGTLPGRSSICAGFTVWQPTRAHRRLAREMAEGMISDPGQRSDQAIFNEMAEAGRVRVTLLRQDLFPNGSLCFGSRYMPGAPIDPPEPFDRSDAYLVHANWMKGVDTKVRALKEAGLWFL